MALCRSPWSNNFFYYPSDLSQVRGLSGIRFYGISDSPPSHLPHVLGLLLNMGKIRFLPSATGALRSCWRERAAAKVAHGGSLLPHRGSPEECEAHHGM